MHYKIITLLNKEVYQFVMCRKHTWHGSDIISCHLSPKSARNDIKEKIGLKMVISFSPKRVLQPLENSKAIFTYI